MSRWIAGLAVLALLRVPGPWSKKAQAPPPRKKAPAEMEAVK